MRHNEDVLRRYMFRALLRRGNPPISPRTGKPSRMQITINVVGIDERDVRKTVERNWGPHGWKVHKIEPPPSA